MDLMHYDMLRFRVCSSVNFKANKKKLKEN